MAQDGTVSLVADTWTQLTNADATKMSFFVRAGVVEVAVVAGAVTPTDFSTSVTYRKGEGEENMTLADRAPGVAGTRVYACAVGGPGVIWRSHD